MRVHLVAACFAVVLASRVACAAEASGAVGSDAGGFGFGNLVRFSASDGPRVPEAARLGAVPGSLPPTTFGEDDLFPEDFAFGVASSAFQIEGDGGDRPRSTWDDFSDARGLGDAARRGIRHFEHVEDDIQYMARAGVRHYRLSLSWPRLQRKDGTPDEAGYAFYERMLAALRREGIEPYVTLHHWDLPASLCQKTSTEGTEGERGERCPAVDWLDPVSVSQFETYATQAFARLGGSVAFWATLNEPKTVANLGYGSGQHAPGVVSATAPLRAGHNMLLAHAAAARTYREKFRERAPGGAGRISLVVNADWREPFDASDGADVAAASRAMDEELGWFADPLYFGDYPKSMRARYGADLPAFTEAQKRSLKGSADYFALNHYASAYVAAAAASSPANSYLGRPTDWAERDVNALGDPIGPTGTCAWLKQAPFGLRKTLALVSARYGRPATYVTENGLCTGPGPGASAASALDDAARVAYVRGYLKAALDAIERDGADVRGYFAWAFFDNFEWADGDAQRFGMVHVDHAGEFGGAPGARLPKKSLAAYREFMTGKHSEHTNENAPLGGRTTNVGSRDGRTDALDETMYRRFAWEGDGDAGASSAAHPGGPNLAALGASPLGRRGGIRPEKLKPAALPSRKRLGASWTEYAPEPADDYEREITKKEGARFALAAAVEALAEAEHPRGSEAASTLEMGRETLAREGDDKPSAETLLAQAERVLAVAEAASRGGDESSAGPGGAASVSAAGDENVSGDEKTAGDAAAMASAANRGGAAALDGSAWSLLRPRRVSAAAVGLGPVWMATFVGVVFGLFLIAIQVSCNLMRKGKRGCGTNEGEVRSLVAVAKAGVRGETRDTKNYGGTPAKTV